MNPHNHHNNNHDQQMEELSNMDSPRSHAAEMRTVLGRLVGRSQSRGPKLSKTDDRNTAWMIGSSMMGNTSKRPRDDTFPISPARKFLRSTPSPRSSPKKATISPLNRGTPTPIRATTAPAKPLPTPPAPSISSSKEEEGAPNLGDSPIQVDLDEFDAIFADFPAPPTGGSGKSTPGPASTSTLVSASASARTPKTSFPPLKVRKAPGQPPTRLEKCLTTMESVWMDLRAEVNSEEQRIGKMYLLEKEVQKLKVQVEGHKRRVGELESLLEKEKEGKGKAAAEAKGMVAHLEKRLAKEQEDRIAAQEALNSHIAQEDTSDRQLFELQQKLDSALQSLKRNESSHKAREKELCEAAKEDRQAMERIMREREDEWRRKLDEADFAHRALKQGGARLARELDMKDRMIEDLERRSKGSF